ncbi:MAG: monofunctional biosynthetic peptidoglycan transglycosylase [Bacteroidota bacterium]|nr:monofunctional biosynthetic peptidoglycan transglycosylase [Bacteroidota bacterium]
MNVFFRGIKILIIFFLVLSLSGVLVYRFVPVPFTPLMVQRVAEQAIGGEKMHLKHQWVSINHISYNMILAAIAGEDSNFINHWGFDFEAIQKAQKHNKRSKRVRGASTISQQTSKNVFLWLGRNYVRKGLEVYFTALIEATWSKKRIMEVYLNSIEMGDGIFGVEAASQKYFHKPASQLTRNEAALIVAAFPNPRKRNPAAPSAGLLKHQQIILSNMSKMEKIEL